MLIEQSIDLYFRPKSFELDTDIYEKIGVRSFKNKLMSPVECLRNRAIRQLGKFPRVKPGNYLLWDWSNEGLMKYERYTRFNEGFHQAVNIFFALQLTRDNPLSNPLFTTIDACALVLGTYLVLVQRYNRARIYKALDHRQTSEIMHKNRLPS